MQRNFSNWVLLLVLLFSGADQLKSQEVVVSKAISIRNDFSYDLLGKIGENILLYRDKGIEQKVTAFDSQMKFKWEKKISLEDKRVWVLALAAQDSSFNILYAYKEKGTEFLRVSRLGQQAEMVDTALLYQDENDAFLSNELIYTISEDKSKIALYYIEDLTKLRLFVIDNDSLSLIWEDEFEFNNTNLLRDFRELLVTDKGDAVILLEKNNLNFKK